MHVAVVGAGALGRVYGVRLAALGGATVSFVVKEAQRARDDGQPMAIRRIDGDQAAHLLARPERVTEVPAHADVVVVCVRGEQLDDPALVDLLRRAPDVPRVIMTPMLPREYARMRGALGSTLIAAMPGVVAHGAGAGGASGETRYWLPRAATTLIDEPRPGDPSRAILDELAKALARAGMSARLEMGVHETNPATTIAFMPLALALDVAGGVDALLADDALVDQAIAAAAESLTLAKAVGKVAGWASLLLRFVGPTTLRMGVGLAKKRAAEAVAYTEEHFGRKVHAQNVAMARAIVALAAEKGTPHAALDALLARLAPR